MSVQFHRSEILDLAEVLDFARKIAIQAGTLIREGRQKREQAGWQEEDTKANTTDLVTEVDKAVEAYIKGEIENKYPTHQFIGEETYDGQPISDEPTWIVDPIDGTANFVHGYHEVCTSIGLAVGGIPIVGVIHNPFLNDTYSAAKGLGAFLNDKTSPLAGTHKPLPSLNKALVCVDCSSKRKPHVIQPKFDSYRRLAANPADSTDIGPDGQGIGAMVHSLRITGSAAMSIAYVAKGSLDVYWEIGCWPWDVCAGICILTEAGGAVFGGHKSDLSGKVDNALLSGRKYLFIRGVDAEGGSTFCEQQSLAKDFYAVTDDFDL